ncbi:MAG: endonuclease/exonuclease/phosphatase family protein [Clostridia bacterium]|nr:endonuclease/exonuclease/phosphatase family protein [Clostridia bacterium]
MKSSKRMLAVLLSLLLLVGVCGIGPVASAEADSKTASILCYNVAGLPNLNYYLGKEDGVDVQGNQYQLGRLLNEEDYAFIAVQEDFTFHHALVEGLDAYPYKTEHSGGVPGGDGLNYFSKTPVYNAKRTTWDQLYGVIDDGADEMTPKGILYACIDLGDGILVDVYNIHADAYGDEGSQAAREDNFRQLAAMIQANTNDRPVIVTGDFNASIHQWDDDGLYEILYQGCGLKDAWVELHNGGNYEDFSYWEETVGGGWPDYWGVWDSLEKFLYRDGGGIHIEANSFGYKDYLNAKGESISDHKAAEVTFTFTKTDDFKENTQDLAATRVTKWKYILRRILIFFEDLFKVFRHWDEAKQYVGLK